MRQGFAATRGSRRLGGDSGAARPENPARTQNMKTRIWTGPAIIAAGFLAAGCGSELSSDEAPDVAEASQAIHGRGDNPVVDTEFTNVVKVGGCSGVLITRNVAMTAAHCLVSTGQQCTSVVDKLLAINEVRIYPNGVDDGLVDAYKEEDRGSVARYTINSIQIHPDAYPEPIGFCDQVNPLGGGDTRCDRANNEQNPFTGEEDTFQAMQPGIVNANDFALVHFDVFDDDVDPLSIATPLPVVTSITDTNPSPDGTIHLDLSHWYGNSTNIEFPVLAVGFGAEDQGGQPERRLTADLEMRLTPDWENRCAVTPRCLDDNVRTSGDCKNGTGFSNPIMEAWRIDTDDDGIADGPYVSFGDSGGPIIHNGRVLGVASRLGQVTRTTEGDKPTELFHGEPELAPGDYSQFYAPAFTPSVAEWIESRLVDWDGDGVATLDWKGEPLDNCWRSFNPGQENCNYLSELAAQERGEPSIYSGMDTIDILGDACDPIPCSVQTANYSKELVWSSGNRTVGYFQTFETHLSSIRVKSQGVHSRLSHGYGLHAEELIVPDVLTNYRFCQSDKANGINCLSADMMQDDRTMPGTPAWNEPNGATHAYHRVTRKETGGQRGIARLVDNGDDDYSVEWDYLVDESFWQDNGIIDSLIDCEPDDFDEASCLGGTFWVNADTLVGQRSGQSDPISYIGGVDGVYIGGNGDNLANSYVNIEPGRTTWTYQPGKPMHKGFNIMANVCLSCPIPEFDPREVFRDNRIVNMLVSYSKLANSAIVSFDGVDWQEAGDMVSTGLAKTLKKTGRYQVVTSADAGDGAGAIALVLNKRGNKVLDAVVQTEEGGIALWSEVETEPFTMAMPKTRGKTQAAFSALRQSLYVVAQKRGSTAQTVFTVPVASELPILEKELPSEFRAKVLDVSYSPVLDQVLVTRQAKIDGSKLVKVWSVNKFEAPLSIAAWAPEPKVAYWAIPTLTGDIVIAASNDKKHVGLKLTDIGGLAEQIRLVDTPIIVRPVGGLGGIRWTLPIDGGVIAEVDPTLDGPVVGLESGLLLGN